MKNKNYGFVRVAAVAPKLKVGEPDFNTKEILRLLKDASKNSVSVVVFPEMSITGYTSADLFFQKLLLSSAKRP